MKKILVLTAALLLAFTLAACGNNNVPDDIVDCLQNPNDPSCDPSAILCEDNEQLVDGECVVVEPTECPDGEELVDGACVVIEPTDCPVGEELVDGACQAIVCPDGEVLQGNSCIVVDNRTPEEIIADLIVENWDGSMDHVDLYMQSMDMSSSMQMETEFNLEVIDTGVTHFITYNITDTYVFGNYDVLRREFALNFDNEQEIEFDIILEEVETGVKIYYNTDFLRALILTSPNGAEVQAVLDTLDANEQWFMFRFDDSLANLVEIEVLLEMLELQIYRQLAIASFAELHTQLETELNVDLDMYGLNVGTLLDAFFMGDMTTVETILNGIDYPGLVHAIDVNKITPMIIDQLTTDQADILMMYPTFDVAAQIAYLQANDTEMWIMNMASEDMDVITEYYDMGPIVYIINAYLNDTLEHFLLKQIVYALEPDLMTIPGLDVAAFKLAVESLDFDAFELENPDLSGLPQAVRDGQLAFDAYVANLALTAPETASLLSPWSGYVLYLEDYLMYLDDIEYGFDNLNVFAQYVDPQYYFSNNMVVLGIEATPEFDILTTFTFDVSEFTTFFEDFMDDLYWFIDGAPNIELPYVEHLNCPVGETCETFPEYNEVLQQLAIAGDIELSMLYNPSVSDKAMSIIFQAADFLDTAIGNNNPDISVTDASLTITFRENGSITLPTNVTDVNMVAQEFAKFTIILRTYDYLEELSDYFMMNPTEVIPYAGTNEPLSTFTDMGIVYASEVFDLDASYVTFGAYDPLNPMDMPDYGIQLVWLDGTNVFLDEIGLEELLLVVGPGTGAPDRADYLMYLGKIDDTNYNITKLMLMYLWENNQDDNYEEQPMP